MVSNCFYTVGIKPYKCKLCGREFNHSGTFSGHKKRFKECGDFYTRERLKSKESKLAKPSQLVQNSPGLPFALPFRVEQQPSGMLAGNQGDGSGGGVKEEQTTTTGDGNSAARQTIQQDRCLASFIRDSLANANNEGFMEGIVGLGSGDGQRSSQNDSVTSLLNLFSVGQGHLTPSKEVPMDVEVKTESAPMDVCVPIPQTTAVPHLQGGNSSEQSACQRATDESGKISSTKENDHAHSNPGTELQTPPSGNGGQLQHMSVLRAALAGVPLADPFLSSVPMEGLSPSANTKGVEAGQPETHCASVARESDRVPRVECRTTNEKKLAGTEEPRRSGRERSARKKAEQGRATAACAPRMDLMCDVEASPGVAGGCALSAPSHVLQAFCLFRFHAEKDALGV